MCRCSNNNWAFLNDSEILVNFKVRTFRFQSLSVPNRPRSIYQYSNMATRLSGQTSLFGVVSFVSKSLLGILHFRVPLCLCFKANLSAKPFLWKSDFDLLENETSCRTHFHIKGFALRLEAQENSEMAYCETKETETIYNFDPKASEPC